MCGIAGFNLNKEYAAEHIPNKDVMLDLVRKGWLYNLHRGYDASGYLRTDLGSNEVRVFKDNAPATEILKDAEGIPVSHLLATHTRAATRGDTEDNRNNHPVFVNGVYVTHNGTIQNHDIIKQYGVQYLGIPEGDIPVVDTAAIAIALSEYAPWELDKLVESMREFSGGFAIHAVWVDHPDVSLIVRGRTSPLTLKYREGAGLLYGSEEDSVFAMTHVLEDTAGWETRKLDEYQAMLVVNGEVKDWRSFKPPVGTYNRPDTVVQRLLPPHGDRKEATVISEAEYRNDWTQETEERSLMLADAKNIEEVYSLEGGLADPKLQFPCDVNKAGAKLAEADFVYRNNKAKLLYAFFGDVEIVLNEHGQLRDVFNHKLFKDEQRWATREAEHVADQVQVPEETFNEFLTKHSGRVINAMEELTDPPYKRQHRNVRHFPGTNNNNSTDVKSTSGSQRLRDVMGNPITERDKRITAEAEEMGACAIVGTVVDQANWYEFPQHEKETMTFMSDPTCVTHKLPYTQHKKVYDCDAAKLSSLVLMSCVEDLDLLAWMWDDFHISADYTPHNCHGACDHFISMRAIADMQGTRLMLPAASRCTKCSSIRTVKVWPEWVKDYLTGTKMRLADSKTGVQEVLNVN